MPAKYKFLFREFKYLALLSVGSSKNLRGCKDGLVVAHANKGWTATLIDKEIANI